jgi:hypothetical protein
MTAQVGSETSMSVPAVDISNQLQALNVQDQSLPNYAEEVTSLSHRSHDPENNLKRTDPFQFGSRLLKEEDNVFEFNAWDHVETDDTYKEFSEIQFAKQREAPVSDFDKSESRLFFLQSPSLHPDDIQMHSSSEVFGLMNETNSATSFAPI